MAQIGESTYRQKQGEVGVVLVFMDESSEVGRLGNLGGGNGVQVRDDGLGVGVNARPNSQSRESGVGVELKEGRLEVLAVHEVDLLGLNVDAELGTERYV